MSRKYVSFIFWDRHSGFVKKKVKTYPIPYLCLAFSSALANNLSNNKAHKPSRPKPIFFFQWVDGMIFICEKNDINFTKVDILFIFLVVMLFLDIRFLRLIPCSSIV